MFCPQCGIRNELNQSYCRQCGQSLSDVRLALKGSAGESLEKLKAGEKLVYSGSVTIAVFAFVALAISIISVILTGVTYNISIIINLLLGLAIGLPLFLAGKANLKRATNLLSKAEEGSSQSLPERDLRSEEQLTTALKADLRELPAEGSVTEGTTLNLKSGEPVGHGETER